MVVLILLISLKEENMDQNFWEKDNIEIPINELMAFTISKIALCDQIRLQMFHMDNIYYDSPIFVWRFNAKVKGLDNLYLKLGECIKSFNGNLNWIMYRGTRLDGRPLKNYAIEPIFIYEIRKSHDRLNTGKILEKGYKELIFKAVEDIEPLCKHIEKSFNLN
jgi:hypothetical protein